MPRFIIALGLCCWFGLAGGWTPPAVAGDGRITGRVSLLDAAGRVIYGDWVRVYLVTEAVAVPGVDLSGANAAVERAARINSAHMTFFRRFRAKMDREGYLVDDRLTRPDGTVAFNQVAPGRYYLVVTFPTMIAGQKGAWQLPVDVVAGRGVHVEMDAANMAIQSPPGRPSTGG